MKSFVSAMLMLVLFVCAAPAQTARVTENFDADWRFLKSDAPDAEKPAFADAQWRQLNVPHDWSIEGPFSPTNATLGAGAFLPPGIGWYRKHFTLPANFAKRAVWVEFDGVMANSDIWINGFHLGKRPFGYVSFSYPLTGHLNFGSKDNVIAVRADNSVQPASRWYSGAGIYRHVRLVATDPVNVGQWGVFVTTPKVSTEQALVRIQTAVTNSSNAPREVALQTTILAPSGEKVASIETTGTVTNGTSQDFTPEVILPKPQLWSLDDPKLYHVVTKIREGGSALDEVTTTFGIRDAKFVADTGFWLNGKNLKIKGVAVHEDAGAFGVAVPMGVWEQRLDELKKLGVNAIRAAHNPPSPAFLDLCDRRGFLVMDEMFDCWTVGKSALSGEHLADYHLLFNDWSAIDTADTVRRDRNHPCIFAYSAGNEIHDTPKAEMAKTILSGLVRVFHANDPTRPVTQALFRPNASHDYDDGLADLLDVIGQNYRENEILAAHTQNPARKIIGTENGHTRAAWLALRDHAPYAGQFLWSGIDYLGESRVWPLVAHSSGLINLAGEPHTVAFERQSWWSETPMVRIVRRIGATDAMPVDPGYASDEKYSLVLFADWTPKNPQPHNENVEVYSNCREVELFLNGKSLGSKLLNPDASPRVWKIPFEVGVIKAVAKNDDTVAATDELRTAGPPAKIVLTPYAGTVADDWDGVVRVTATITDQNGVAIPDAANLVSFKLSGPGVIAAVDNADTQSHEPFQASERHAYQGRCFAFVKAAAASGTIKLTASSPGLTDGAAAIKASQAPAR